MVQDKLKTTRESWADEQVKNLEPFIEDVNLGLMEPGQLELLIKLKFQNTASHFFLKGIETALEKLKQK